MILLVNTKQTNGKILSKKINRFFSFSDILSTPLPNDTIDIQSIINARRLYDSCINESAINTEGVEKLLSVIDNEFGGWPILQGSLWDSSSFNLTNLLVRLREYSHNIIYSCGTSIDDRNSSVYYIRVNT